MYCNLVFDCKLIILPNYICTNYYRKNENYCLYIPINNNIYNEDVGNVNL